MSDPKPDDQPKAKVKEPAQAKAMAQQLVTEQDFYEGAPDISETFVPGLSVFTVVGIIPFGASLARQAWTKYKFTNRRIEVIWIEYEGKGRKRKRVRNPYSGFVVSVDLKKGLCVQLDGFEKEEYLVTDEDEWSWLPGTEEDDDEMEPDAADVETGDDGEIVGWGCCQRGTGGT